MKTIVGLLVWTNVFTLGILARCTGREDIFFTSFTVFVALALICWWLIGIGKIRAIFIKPRPYIPGAQYKLIPIGPLDNRKAFKSVFLVGNAFLSPKGNKIHLDSVEKHYEIVRV